MEIDGKTLNPAKARMQADEAALGMIVRYFRSGEIARIAREAGLDFLFIDTQHALFSVESIGHIAQTALAVGVAPLVRVRSHDDPDIPRLLDSGVMGLVVPDVANADQARQVVAASLYPPAGRRSMGGPSPVFDFRALPLPESTRALNQGTLICCMIETREGVKNMAEIAAVDGVDVLHIGCNDLLGDLGKMGQFQDPELLDTVARLIEVCRAHGKHAGLGGEKDPARQAQYIRDGIRFVTTTSDIGFISEGAKRVVDTLRAAL